MRGATIKIILDRCYSIIMSLEFELALYWYARRNKIL